MTDLDAHDAAYEVAEAAFIEAVRQGVERNLLSDLADAVSAAATAFNAAAYEAFHAMAIQDRTSLDLLTERTEVLSELWTDLAAAYRV